MKEVTCLFFFQALVKGGLTSLARDPGFVSVAKKEMAEAMHMPVSEMEDTAQGILKERSSSLASVKKRRPIPIRPSVLAAAAPEASRPEPAVRRKKRPVPMIPSLPMEEQDEADSNV